MFGSPGPNVMRDLGNSDSMDGGVGPDNHHIQREVKTVHCPPASQSDGCLGSERWELLRGTRGVDRVKADGGNDE